MTRGKTIREMMRSHRNQLVVAILGILGLLLLDFPFMMGLYDYSLYVFGIASGFQLALYGGGDNLAQTISEVFPYGRLILPGSEFTLTPPLPLVWLILVGAFMSEVLGIIAIALPDKRSSEVAGRLITIGGGLMLIGGLTTLLVVILTVSRVAIPYIAVLPGWALFLEPILGGFVAENGIRIFNRSASIEPKQKKP